MYNKGIHKGGLEPEGLAPHLCRSALYMLYACLGSRIELLACFFAVRPCWLTQHLHSPIRYAMNRVCIICDALFAFDPWPLCMSKPTPT